jgi:hypothetical protein
MSGLSRFFYQKSSLLIAVLLTVIFINHLFLVMTGKAGRFELAYSNIKSLGTSVGFDQADVLAFFGNTHRLND